MFRYTFPGLSHDFWCVTEGSLAKDGVQSQQELFELSHLIVVVSAAALFWRYEEIALHPI